MCYLPKSIRKSQSYVGDARSSNRLTRAFLEFGVRSEGFMVIYANAFTSVEKSGAQSNPEGVGD